MKVRPRHPNHSVRYVHTRFVVLVPAAPDLQSNNVFLFFLQISVHAISTIAMFVRTVSLGAFPAVLRAMQSGGVGWGVVLIILLCFGKKASYHGKWCTRETIMTL